MMRDKQYQFNLTEKQVDMINELIKNEFQYASDIDIAVVNGEELMSLLSYINFEFKFEMETHKNYSKACDRLTIKGNFIKEKSKNDMQLEMGDIFVTLIILCKQLGIDCVECLDMAYKKISKRKGKTVNGLFIKEEDL